MMRNLSLMWQQAIAVKFNKDMETPHADTALARFFARRLCKIENSYFSKRVTAFHEAGHTALALLHEIPFEYVTISDSPIEDNTPDKLKKKYVAGGHLKVCEDHDLTDENLEDVLKLLMGGLAAEIVVYGLQCNKDGAMGDIQKLETFIEYLPEENPNKAAINKAIPYYLECAQADLEQNLKLLWDLQYSLLKKGRLTYAEATQIAQQNGLKPVQPENLQTLE